MPDRQRDRVPNDRLRRARLAAPSPSGSGRPMSRRELAEVASGYLPYPMDEKYVGKLERGVYCWPSAAHRTAIRRALGVHSDYDLGFYVARPPRAAGVVSAQRGAPEFPPGSGPLGGIAGPQLHGGFQHWSVLGEPLRETAFAPSATEPAALRLRLDRCKALDGEAGPTCALPEVLALLADTARCAREARPPRRAAMLGIAAEGAEFAGWLYRDLQVLPSATYWYDRAMDWAQEAQDTALQGYILIKKSQMAFDARDAGRVRALADAAVQGPWRMPARIRSEAVLQQALGMAMTGEAATQVERVVAEAEAVLAGIGDAAVPEEPGHGAFADLTFRLRRAACYTEAGQPRRAAELFQDVIAAGELSRRDDGFFRARRSAALALSGEPDEASAVALEAVRIARATSSGRTLKLVSEAATVLDRWRDRSGPRELREALVALA